MEEGNKLLFLGRRYELGDVIDYLRDFTYGVTGRGAAFRNGRDAPLPLFAARRR